MKSVFCCLVAVAVVAMSGVNATAGWLSGNRAGTVNGNATAFTPGSGSLVVGLTAGTFLASGSTGAFNGTSPAPASVPGVVFGTLFFDSPNPGNFDPLGNTVGDGYTFSSAEWGSFVSTISNELTSGDPAAATGVATRTLSFSGTFTPGNSGYYENDATPVAATFQLTWSRTDGGTNSVSWSFDTTAGAGAVPEPTSIAIFGLGAVGFAARRFRRK